MLERFSNAMLFGRLGDEKGDTMYHWVEDKEFLKRSYSLCADLANQLVQKLKSDDIVAEMRTVGSKGRNMITQNANEKIDFDFNLVIEDAQDYDERDLKKAVRCAFNEVLEKNGLKECEDSTSALTTKAIQFSRGNRTPFSIDVCIVTYDRFGQLNRLIHEKTGFEQLDRYYWNAVPFSDKLREKENALKPDYWLEVRDKYLEKKNMYLQRPCDHSHPSYVCYIEAVNEVYYKNFGWR